MEVKVHDDFILTGYEVLDMLNNYIHICDGVSQPVACMSGPMGRTNSVAAMDHLSLHKTCQGDQKREQERCSLNYHRL